MSPPFDLERIAVVLVHPRVPENIGAAARAMKNMGLKDLILVAPRNCDLTRMLKMATHEAADIIEELTLFESLQEAVAPFQHVVGTTARLGRQRQTIVTPRQMARQVVPLTRENRAAVVFGPEDRGLGNEDIRLCHQLVNIPTARFSSINLAQAVMIVSYELQVEERRLAATGTPETPPALATSFELENMYTQLKDLFIRISFINPDNPDYWMNNLRRFFFRLPLRAKEVRIIRGICRQMNWYAGQRYRDGFADGLKARSAPTEDPPCD